MHDSKTLLIVLIILIVIQIIVFVKFRKFKKIYLIFHEFEDEEERKSVEKKLLFMVVVTILATLLGFYFYFSTPRSHEYGLFKRKDKMTVPPVAAPTANRKIYGNPMKKPTYNTNSKYQEPIDASKIYGGASAAADINRRNLNRRK